MQWSEDGIILGTRRHGESSVIVELMTRAHGRHLGLVRGGRSRRLQPLLQPGNSVHATWRARLDEHLGNYAVEPAKLRAASLMESAAGLYAVQVIAAHLRLLPERDPHPQLYDGLAASLDWLGDPLVAGVLVVRFEVQVLNELGFGLDLDRCAASGASEDLAYVSPKTGRAVSRSAGEPWRNKLLTLPSFLLSGGGASPTPAELVEGFDLTGYFFARHVFEPRGISAPEARASLIALMSRPAGTAARA
jgi:DNA repair protein RecO (recombination protein O)